LSPFLFRRAPRQVGLLSVLSIGLWLIYSWVSYKTPWCVLSYEWGLIFIASFWIGKWVESRYRSWVIVGLTIGLLVSVYQAYDVAYDNPDQEGHLYIYGQTYRDLMVPLNSIVMQGKQDTSLHAKIKIQVISAFTWPLPFILGEYKSVAYYGEQNAPSVLDADYVILDRSFEAKLSPRLVGTYERSEVKSRQWASPLVFFNRKR
jgi:hypothetical protein